MRVRDKPSLASSALKGLKAVSSCRTPRLEPFVAIANKKLGTSVQAINAQIAALQARADAIRMQEVGEVLAEPRDAVAHHGLAAIDLTLAASAPRAVNAAKAGKPGRMPSREPGAKAAGKHLRAAKSTRAAGCSTGCHQAKIQEPLKAGEVPSLVAERSRPLYRLPAGTSRYELPDSSCRTAKQTQRLLPAERGCRGATQAACSYGSRLSDPSCADDPLNTDCSPAVADRQRSHPARPAMRRYWAALSATCRSASK